MTAVGCRHLLLQPGMQIAIHHLIVGFIEDLVAVFIIEHHLHILQTGCQETVQ